MSLLKSYKLICIRSLSSVSLGCLSIGILGLLLGCQATNTEQKDGAPENQLSFVVSFPETSHSESLSGRILLFFNDSSGREPRLNFRATTVCAIDVEDLAPGETVTFLSGDFREPDALTFPDSFGRLSPGTYFVQALIDHDQTRRSFNSGPGNLYSEVLEIELGGEVNEAHTLIANKVIKPEVHEENDWVKVVKVKSDLLSAFHQRDVFVQAAVVLPFGYVDEPDRSYPVYYEITGFGGSAFQVLNYKKFRRPTQRQDWKEWTSGKTPFRGFRIVLDAEMPLGHSVFADSANNGPVGQALIEELIPAIEERFRIIAEPRARFVGGHSSGGWSSLWLQITYPDFFGGCWSTAPDPVDFRAFQTMNLYEDRNGHWTPEGLLRPVSRSRHETNSSFATYNHIEYVLGHGWQLGAFNASFSPRREDGNPMPIMDQLMGHINPEVAEYWKNYDIRLILESNWEELGPRVKGKIHITGGGWDTYYLNPALEMLKDFLDTTDFGGYVEIIPGSHGSFLTPDFRKRAWKEMADEFEQSQ